MKRAPTHAFCTNDGCNISIAKWSKQASASASSFSASFLLYHYPSAGQPRATHRRSPHYVFNQAVMLSQSSVIALQYPWGSCWFLLLWLIQMRAHFKHVCIWTAIELNLNSVPLHRFKHVVQSRQPVNPLGPPLATSSLYRLHMLVLI